MKSILFLHFFVRHHSLHELEEEYGSKNFVFCFVLRLICIIFAKITYGFKSSQDTKSRQEQSNL